MNWWFYYENCAMGFQYSPYLLKKRFIIRDFVTNSVIEYDSKICSSNRKKPCMA
jgi:hypothetical protein